jgi:trimeric autotransporter adhesin
VDSSGAVLTSSASTGNQWYKDGVLIPGATGQQYVVLETGTYWTVVTVNGCSSLESNHVYILIIGIESLSGPEFSINPVPNDGHFTLSILSSSIKTYSLEIWNILGIKVYAMNDIRVNGLTQKTIDLRPVPEGVYTLVLKDRDNRVVKQFIVNR